MHHLTSPLLFTALLAAGSVTSAERVDFNSHDSNGDGYLTESEWADAGTDIQFDAIDTNRDGYLVEAEVEAGFAVRRNVSGDSTQDATTETTSAEAGEGDHVPAAIDPPMQDPSVQDRPADDGSENGAQAVTISESEDQPRAVILYDENGDQRVSRSEARKDGELVTHFVIWDTNQDGYLDQAEIDNGDRRPGSGADTGDRQQGQRQESAREEPQAEAGATSVRADNSTGTTAQFTMLDANADGVLDEAEAAESEYVHTNFDAWDTDHDGFVSEDEADNGWMGGNND